MKKYLLLFLLLSSFGFSERAARLESIPLAAHYQSGESPSFEEGVLQITRLPEEFKIEERFLSLISTFDVKTELESFAIARKRLLSFTTVFDLEDMQERLLATARERFFAWGTIADVQDARGEKIGWIEEELLRILPWAEYRVFNSENTLVALAKMDFWGTKFSVTNPKDSKEVYATITRPFIRLFRDSWTVQIFKYSVFEENLLDPRLLVILALFQTDKDHRDRLRNEIRSNLGREFEEFDGTRIFP